MDKRLISHSSTFQMVNIFRKKKNTFKKMRLFHIIFSLFLLYIFLSLHKEKEVKEKKNRKKPRQIGKYLFNKILKIIIWLCLGIFT